MPPLVHCRGRRNFFIRVNPPPSDPVARCLLTNEISKIDAEREGADAWLHLILRRVSALKSLASERRCDDSISIEKSFAAKYEIFGKIARRSKYTIEVRRGAVLAHARLVREVTVVGSP